MAENNFDEKHRPSNFRFEWFFEFMTLNTSRFIDKEPK